MTTYKHYSIHGIGIRTVVTDTKPEPRQLWRDFSKPVSNPEQCKEEWHLLWREFCKFRRNLPPEICEGRFRPLTVEDLRNPNNANICDNFADEINSFLKKWVR